MAVDNKYIVKPTISSITSFTADASGKQAFSITIQFNWGDYFDNKNPYTYLLLRPYISIRYYMAYKAQK